MENQAWCEPEPYPGNQLCTLYAREGESGRVGAWLRTSCGPKPRVKADSQRSGAFLGGGWRVRGSKLKWSLYCWVRSRHDCSCRLFSIFVSVNLKQLYSRACQAAKLNSTNQHHRGREDEQERYVSLYWNSATLLLRHLLPLLAAVGWPVLQACENPLTITPSTN